MDALSRAERDIRNAMRRASYAARKDAEAGLTISARSHEGRARGLRAALYYLREATRDV